MIIGMLGLIGSGKNTVAEELERKYGFAKDSFAATLKDACASIFGWNRAMLEGDTEKSRAWREQVDTWWAAKLGIPDFTPRLALQLIGTDTFREHFHSDIWILSLLNKLENTTENTVIADARFRNEIEAIREAGGILIRVDRGEKPEWWDIACEAYNGSIKAARTMQVSYPLVHKSEWSWAGCRPDEIILNVGTMDQLRGMVELIANKYQLKQTDYS